MPLPCSLNGKEREREEKEKEEGQNRKTKSECMFNGKVCECTDGVKSELTE